MPIVTTQKVGSGDSSWLDGSFGLREARTVSIDLTKFTAAKHFPEGFLPSGTQFELDAATGLYGPLTDTGTLAGFLPRDESVRDATATIGVPMVDHGRIVLNRLPVTATAAITAAVPTTGQFIFI